MMAEVNDKIEKLWKLLEAHNRELNSILFRSKVAIKDRNVTTAGDLAGQIVVIGQSDCCYLVAIEILDSVAATKLKDLKTRKT